MRASDIMADIDNEMLAPGDFTKSGPTWVLSVAMLTMCRDAQVPPQHAVGALILGAIQLATAMGNDADDVRSYLDSLPLPAMVPRLKKIQQEIFMRGVVPMGSA